jgi:trimeric autotransporter adhesin
MFNRQKPTSSNNALENLKNMTVLVSGGVQHLITRSLLITAAISVVSAGLVTFTVVSVYKCDINDWLYINHSQNWWRECGSEFNTSAEMVDLQNQLTAGNVVYENGVLKTTSGKIISLGISEIGESKLSSLKLENGQVLASGDSQDAISLKQLAQYINSLPKQDNDKQRLTFKNGVLGITGGNSEFIGEITDIADIGKTTIINNTILQNNSSQNNSSYPSLSLDNSYNSTSTSSNSTQILSSSNSGGNVVLIYGGGSTTTTSVLASSSAVVSTNSSVTNVFNGPTIFNGTVTTNNSVINNGALTQNGAANFNGPVSFSTLPTLPLAQNNLWLGNTSNKASELAPGNPGTVLSINAFGVPTWLSAGTAVITGNALFSTSASNGPNSTVLGGTTIGFVQGNNINTTNDGSGNITIATVANPNFAGLNVTGATSLGTLTTTGNNNLGGNTTTTNLTATGATSLNTLNTIGNATIGGNLAVAGNQTTAGTTTTGGIVNNGALAQSGNVAITGNTTQVGDISNTGNLVQNGKTTTTGVTTTNGLVNTGTTTNTGLVTNTAGTTTTGGTTTDTLNVIGLSTFSQLANFIGGLVSAGITNVGNFIQTGLSTFNGNTIFNGDTTTNGSVSITGNTTQTGNIITTGNNTTNGNTFTTGTTTTNGIINTGTTTTNGLVNTGSTTTAGLTSTGPNNFSGGTTINGALTLDPAALASLAWTASDGVNTQSVGPTQTLTYVAGSNLTASVSPTRQVTYGIVGTPTFAGLNVTGATSLGALTTTGNNMLGGNTTANNLTATGATALNGLTNAGALTQNGNSTFNGNTNTTGTATFVDTNTTGNSLVNNLTATGNTILNTLTSLGASILNGLTNNGLFTQTGDVAITGNTTQTGNVTNTGNLIQNGNTTTTGVTTTNGLVNTGTTTNTGAVTNTAGTTTTGGTTTDTLTVTGSTTTAGITSTGPNNFSGSTAFSGPVTFSQPISLPNGTAESGTQIIGGKVRLGGNLLQPTIIGADSTNTLALTGLQSGLSTDSILIQDPTTGVIKNISASGLLAGATTVSNNSNINSLTTTVNGVISSPVNIINNNGLTLTGTNITSKVNGVTSTLDILPALAAGTTNALSSALNVMTSNVNGAIATSNIINSNSLVSGGNQITGSVNGVNAGPINIINSGSLATSTNTLSGSINGVSLGSVNLINSNALSGTGTTLTSNINGISSAFDIQPLINAGTTNTLTLSKTNGLQSAVNGVLSTQSVPSGIVNEVIGYNAAGNPIYQSLSGLLTGATTNILSTSGTNLTSNVNGVTTTQDLQSVINAGTTVSNTLTGPNLSTIVNGVTGSSINLLPLLTGSTTNTLLNNGTNGFTSTVNGVASGLQPIINSNTLVNNGINTLTNTTNGVIGSASIINTVANNSNINTLTTTVNGVAGAGVNIINSNLLGLSGTNLTSTTNGVASNVLDLTGLLTSGTTNIFGSTGNVITSNVNGVSQTTNLINSGALISNTNTLSGNVNGVNLGSVNLINSNNLTGTGTTLTSNINGVSSAFDIQPLINAGTANTLVNNGTNTLTNTTNGVVGTASIINNNILANNGTNGFTSTVNGVSSGLQPIINSNALSLTGTNLTSTVNGVATTALDLQSAINAGTTVSNSLVGTYLTTTVNGVTGAALDLASLQPTANNGLTINPANNVQLGGVLVQDTTVDGQNSFNLDFVNNIRASLVGLQTQIGGTNTFNSTDPYQIAIGHDNVLSYTDQYITGNNNAINSVGSTNVYITGYNNRIPGNVVSDLYNLGSNNDFQGGTEILNVGSNNTFKDPTNKSGTFGFNNLNYGTESFVFGSNLTTSGDRTVSLGTNDATKAVIDNGGRLTIRGAFSPNGQDGNPNQVLISNGTSLSPSWTDITNLLPTTTNTLIRSGNNLTSTVNGVQSITQAIGSNSIGLSGSNLTTTVNGVASNSLNLLPLLTGSTTNTLANNGTNGFTSTVNGVSSGLQPIINTNTLTLSGANNNTLTNLTNGVGNSVNIIGSNTLSLAGNTLTSIVNGVSANTTFSVATNSNTGLLTAADWNTFNNKVTAITGTNGVAVGGTTTNPILSLSGISSTPCSPTQKLTWTSTAFNCVADIDTGITSLTAVGSTPNANGGSISGTALTLQPADLTNPGVVTAGTQTIGGVKTFNSANTDFFNGASPTNDIFRITPNAGTGTQFIGNLTTANLSGAKTWTLPDVTGTVCLRENCLTSISATTGTTGLTLTPTTGGTGAVTQVLAGTLATANGGTGLTTVGSNGQVLSSNGATLSYTTPTVTAGNVTGANNLTSATTGVTVTGGTGATLTAASIAIQNATATQPGLLTTADFTTFNAKESALTFTGNGLFSRTGNTVTGTTCLTINQILKWNGTTFACAADSGLTAAITSINGDTTAGQTLTSGNAGTALAVSTTGGVTTINIPLAGLASTQGLISNGTQTIGGNKTFDSVVSTFKNTATPTADFITIEPNLIAGTAFNGKITSADLTGNQTYTLPNATGTVCLSSNNCGFVSGTANNLTTTTTGLTVGGGTGATLTAATVNYNLATGIAGLTAGVQGVLGGTGTTNTYVGADGQLHLLPSAPITTTVNGSAGAITLSGTNTVTGNGTTTPFQLVNDSPTPGNSLYYGTNATGTKGFFTLPTSGSTTNTLVNNGVNGLTSTVNGVSSGTQPIINTVTTALSGNLILTTVNGITSAGANVPNATLSGFTPSTNTAITATDSIIQALQKLQAGNTAQDTSISTLTVASHSPVTLGTPNGLSLSGQVLSLGTASTSTAGALTSVDWNTFNTKQSALTFGNLTSGTTGVSVINGIGAVIGTGSTINIQNATTAQPGLLTAADYTTFNAKLSAEVDGIIGNEITNVGATTALVRAGSGTSGSPYTVDVKSCSNNEILKYATGTSTWVCGADAGSVITPSNLTTGTTGVTITGGTGATLTPALINIQNAGAAQPGLLTAADWTTFNAKESALTFSGNGLFSRTGNTITGNGLVAGAGISISGTTISNSGVSTVNGFNGVVTLSGTNSITGNGSATPFQLVGDVSAPGNSFYYGTNAIGTKGYYALPSSGVTTIGTAGGSIANGASISGSTLTLGFSNATNPGILSSADWTTFNGKENVLTFSGPLSRTGNTISTTQANATTPGFLTAADWNTFNTKLSTEVDGVIGNEVTNTTDTSLLRSGAGTAGSPYTLGVNLTPTGTASTATTTSGSGLEISGGLGLLRGCTNAQVLKWNNTTKAWECSNEGSVAGVDVIATKTTALTALMSNTAQTVIYPTITQNINSSYSGTTGIYTTPTGGTDTYTVEAQIGFTTAGLNMRIPCIAIRRAGVIISSNCNADYNDTAGGSINGRNSVAVSATMVLTAGQTVDVITYTDTNPAAGTVPVFDTTAGVNYLTVKRVGNALNIASDRNLKKEIKSFDLGLKDLMDVNTVSYLYNGKAVGAQNDGVEHVGIIAQDLQNTSFGRFAVKQGTDGYLRYDPTSLLYATINGVKELNTGFKQNSFGTANISGLTNIFGNNNPAILTIGNSSPNPASIETEPKGIGEQLVESLTNSLQSVTKYQRFPNPNFEYTKHRTSK